MYFVFECGPRMLPVLWEAELLGLSSQVLMENTMWFQYLCPSPCSPAGGTARPVPGGEGQAGAEAEDSSGRGGSDSCQDDILLWEILWDVA